jgi:ABC-type phosphate transport system substrate-binding protein
MTRTTRFAVAFVAIAGGILATRAARAQDAGVTQCSSLSNPIYVGGSSAFVPTLNLYAAKLAQETPATTIIYVSSSSCVGAGAIGSHMAITGTGTYYLPNGTASPTNCSIGANTYLDVGVSDVFYDSCVSAQLAPTAPAGLRDALGPVQAMEIIVPQNNTTGYLTSAEGNVIWGCGSYTSSDNKVTFGTNGVFVRGTTSGSQIITAAGINLPDLSFFGNNMTPQQVSGGSPGMAAAVGNFPSKNQGSLNAIGFLGADVFDLDHAATAGAEFIALPFAANGQTAAYYVDSEPGSRDRKNVRDGHYFNWGYEHLLYTVPTPDGGAAGQPSAAASKLVNLVTGMTTDPTFDYVQLDAVAGTIPLCAMSVAKANDAPGYLSVYTPGSTCNCAYVASASGNVPASCTTCTATDGGSSCGSGKSCQHGYCE